LAPIIVVSAKCIVLWILKFVGLNTETSNECTSSILLDLNFRGFS